MKFTVRSLASGSSGNALLVRTDKTTLLIDCGLSLLRLKRYLSEEEIEPADLDGVVLTHEHSDHSCGILSLTSRHRTAVFGTFGTLRAIFGQEGSAFHRPVRYGESVTLGDVQIGLFPVQHDAAEPAGVTITHSILRKKIAVVTDTGSVTPGLLQALKGADLIVVESNHDVDMLESSRYPARLKARIRGGLGHLSNDDCARLVADLANDRPALTVWLAHLSKENNSPTIALGHTRAVLAQTRRKFVKVDVARRDRPSVRWSCDQGSIQLELIF